MKELKDEADLLTAQLRQLVLAQARDVDAVDDDASGRRRVEPGDQAEQRRLAAARRPDDRDELPLWTRSVSGWRMVSGSEPLITVLETSRSSIMVEVRPQTSLPESV